MPDLVFGIVDVQYANERLPAAPPRAPKVRRDGQPYKARPRVREGAGVQSGEQSTGDVATWLENKYHVFEVFYELHKDEIHELIASGYEEELNALLSGRATANVNYVPMQQSMDEIYRMFQIFIDTKEMDALGIPGVPTEASLLGVNHALKIKRGPVRPSFKDTGLYRNAFHPEMRQD